jgi:hypothetical protein
MGARTLALAIPTYNRAAILEDNLRAMQPTLERLGIAVHILDDSSNGDTAALVTRLQATTQLALHYQHNLPALRHDANLVRTLTTPRTDHVWLLGDANVVGEAALAAVCAQLRGQDFVFVNGRSGPESASIEDIAADRISAFLAERAWDLSYTGATIYSQRVVQWWLSGADRKPCRNFPQLSAILGFVASGQATTASWIGTRTVHSHPRKTQSYWLKTAVEVWGKDWYDVITAHAAAFAGCDLAQVLKSHARRTTILSLKHLLVMRAAGLYTPAMYKTYRTELRACAAAPAALLPVLAELPQTLAAAMVSHRPSWQRRFLPAAA